MWAVAFVVGCSGDDTTTPTDTETDTETPPEHTAAHTGGETIPHTGDSGSTAETGSTGHTGTVPFDCATAPTSSQGVRAVPGGRGYHGLAFDHDGYLYGQDSNGNIIKTDFYGGASVFAPGVWSQGMDTLPSGELVIAVSGGGVAIIDPVTLGYRVAGTNIANIYGVVVGPDGMIYVGNRYDAARIDPVSGDATVYLPGSQAQSVGFSPDGTKFYFTTTFSYALFETDLDANYDPVAPPSRLADFGSSYRDGLAVDTCGNIYVTDYGVRRMYKIDPLSGNVAMYLNFGSLTNYGHYAQFGSGIGGWRTDAIYVPQPYNNNEVGEIIIGIPGTGFP